MAARTIRRRIHHRDVDERIIEHMSRSSYDSVNEPLLGSYHRGNVKEYDDSSQQDWVGIKSEISLHWTYFFSDVIAQWIANIITGSGLVLGRFLPLSSVLSYGQNDAPICLSPLQEERFRNLKQRLEVQFDGSSVDHQNALRQLWQLAYPDQEIPPLKSESWKEMGWQGNDPSTDFRGGGYISLENLIYFAKYYPKSFYTLLHKTEGKRAEWEYPFATAGINLSFMLLQMLDLQSGMPTSKAGVSFLELLAIDESAFDNLYCVAFCMLDAQWLARRASYMEFNEVLKSTRKQLERELALEDVTSIKDLQAYTLLKISRYILET